MYTEEDEHECSVRILSETDGERSVFSAVGVLRFCGESFFLSYRKAEAVVRLETDGAGLRMRRTGDIYLELPFMQGAETAGRIGLSPQAAGPVGVYTARMEIVRERQSGVLSVELEYALRYAAHEQRTLLRLRADNLKSNVNQREIF